jgi:predicted secreted protein
MVYKWISSAVLVVLIMSSLGWVFYSENQPYLEGMQPGIAAATSFTYVDASMNEMLQTTGWKSTDTMVLNRIEGASSVGTAGNAFSGNKTSNKMYNSDNFDITYHPEPVAEYVWKLDANGKLIKVPYYEIKNKTWYSVGKYPAIYVPNYEESVRLSRG